MRRKPLFGCLGVAALVAVAGLLFLYFNVLSPMQEIMGDLKQLGALSELNERVVAPGPYLPPDDGALSADQLERFAGVQTFMRAALGSEYAELRRRAEKLRGLRREEDGSIVKPGFRDVLDSFKGLGPLLERAKTAQIDALNRAGFSYSEYRWVRETAYVALGKDNADVYLEEFAERVMGLGDEDGRGGPGPEAPAVAPEDAEAPGDPPAALPEEARTPGDPPAALPDPAIVRITPLVAGESARNRVLASAYTDSLSLWEPFLVFGL